MTALEQYLSDYFEVIRSEELNKITSLFKLTVLKKGEYFLKPGQYCDKFCFIKSGFLRIFSIAGDKEITQWIALKGHFGTDLSSFFFGRPSRWAIQALTDTEIYSITKSDYNKISTTVLKWNDLERSFIIKCFTFLEDRIFSHLSMNAEERYQFFYESNREFFNQVPQQYIASMLGMTSETFSRIRKKQLP